MLRVKLAFVKSCSKSPVNHQNSQTQLGNSTESGSPY